MTPGTNILGYNYPSVSDAVAKVVKDGNMSSLNAAEEVELAEKLVKLHPWADMAGLQGLVVKLMPWPFELLVRLREETI